MSERCKSVANQPAPSTHKAGPWWLDPGDVMNPDRAFGIIAHDNAEGPDGNATQCVAEVCDGPTALADARLIAAAPDLLAACKDLLRFAESVRPGGRVLESDADLESARAAIARAEGGEA